MTMQAYLSVNESAATGIVRAMDTVGKRIRHLRQLLGKTQQEFADALHPHVEGGITRGAVGNWELDKGIKTENLMLISEVTGAAVEWLASGKGRVPQRVDDLRRQTLMDGGFLEDDPAFTAPFEPEAPDPIDPDAIPTIPRGGIVEVDARGGTGPGGHLQHIYRRDGDEVRAVDAVKPDPWVFPGWFMQNVLRARAEHILALETQGDSMEPTIDPGAVVFIDTRHTVPSPDGVYAIRDRWGHIQVKRLETFGEARSDIRVVSDKDGRGVSMPLDDIVIVGKVIASWRRL